MSDLRQTITQSIKEAKIIQTNLGEITVTGDELGAGKNGLVYPVAFEGDAVIKFLLHDTAAGESVPYQRFIREFRRMVRLPQHENIVRLIHFDEIAFGTAHVPAIFMEKCDMTLAEFVKNNGPFPPEMVDALLRQLCPALNHFHLKGIIHRDLKPDNILIRGNTFVIADFGIAWFDPDHYEGIKLTQTGDRVANHMFSAPEQLEMKNTLTPAADIYALGQIAYWCVYGEVIKGSGHKPLRDLSPEYGHFDSVIDKMVQNTPSARLQNGHDIVTAIDANDKRKSKELRERLLTNRVNSALETFDKNLRMSFPGCRGVCHITDKAQIDRFLERLNNQCDSDDIWWNRGNTASSIIAIEKLNEKVWVIQNTGVGIEVKISDVWVGRNSDKPEQCFVLIRSEAMPSFGYYGNEYDAEYETVDFFRDKFIHEAEVEDGYTIIDGEVIEVENTVKRKRFLKPHYLFLITKWNPIMHDAGTKISNELNDIIEEVESTGDVYEERLTALLSTPIKYPFGHDHY